MQPTRRSWAAGALAALLAVLAAAFARPLLLAGAAQVGAWLLARQYVFARDVERTARSLSVRQEPARTELVTGVTAPLELAATVSEPSPLALDVTAGLPTAATAADPPAVTLEPDATAAARTLEVTWPVAGSHRFAEATVTAGDGFFRQTVPAGEAPTVTVEPRGPRDVHVGEGGGRATTVYGEHRGERIGFGIEPAELREYAPGDTANRIDWNATARLATPHVREYEVETTRHTLLVVDHRATTGTGPRAERKLDYLREVALAVAARARRLGDPIGLLAVGDEGITRTVEPAPTQATAARVRRALLELEPTTDDGTRSDAPSRLAPADGHPRGPTAADARRSLAALEDDDGAFARTLRPFYADRRRYHERIERDPLFNGARTALERTRGSHWTVIFTDDSHPSELRETVKLARRRGNRVVVCLAPTVLYDSGALADVERAYDRYVSFERLRRALSRMERVTALEVGPGDRLSAVLAAGRTARGDPA